MSATRAEYATIRKRASPPRELLRLALALPAAVALIGAFSFDIPLGPLLDGMVGEYMTLSRTLWDEWIPITLRARVPVSHVYLSFTLMLALPIAANSGFLLARRADVKRTGVSWPTASSFCIVFVSFAFGTMAELWRGSPGMVLYFSALLLFVVLVILLAAATILYGTRESEINLVIATMIGFLVAVSLGAVYADIDQPDRDMKRIILFAATLLGIYLSFVQRLKAPVYVLMSFLGLAVAGFLVDGVIPAIREIAAQLSELEI